MEILKCEALRKVYSNESNQVVALDSIDMSVEKGEFIAIVGASGSGKSTLLHILGCVDKPTAGRVLIEGTDISAMNRTQEAIFRRRKVGLVYQFYNLIPTMTVRKNILIPLLLDKRKVNQDYFSQIVNSLGIAEKLDALPNQLSGGQQQRVAIARSLIYRPALLLADEPTGNLDQKNSREIVDMLKLSNRNLKQTILMILLLVSFSLVLVIHNSFAVSMNDRVQQLGIFSSVGATPLQIVICLVQEAAILCVAPVLLGGFCGIALSYAALEAVNAIAAEMSGRAEAVFSYHPAVFLIAISLAGLTAIFSAWLPARKLSKLTALQAIRSHSELQLRKKRKPWLLPLLFGIEGELASNAVKAQKKALRTSSLSLTLSFLGLTLMLCGFTLSGISTQHTYFERYQEAWDIMVTVKDTALADFALTDELRASSEVKDLIVYQKAAAESIIPAKRQSDELLALGGLAAVAESAVTASGDVWQVNSPLVIMDDDSFLAYCERLGIPARLDGVIALNRIWDRLNSNFRFKEYVPLVNEQDDMAMLNVGGETLEIPIISYTQSPPVLREEYASFALVHFIPISLWQEHFAGLAEGLAESEPELYIRALAAENHSLDALSELERKIARILEPSYEMESENRIQEKVTNDYMIWGYQMFIGSLCVLLALIGIANIFSNTLGFVRARKREIARYSSVGMTLGSIKKMFAIEALIIAGRPLIITLPFSIIAAEALTAASFLESSEFWAKIPLAPIAWFVLLIFAFVALAYYLGGRKALNVNLAEALRSEAA